MWLSMWLGCRQRAMGHRHPGGTCTLHLALGSSLGGRAGTSWGMCAAAASGPWGRCCQLQAALLPGPSCPPPGLSNGSGQHMRCSYFSLLYSRGNQEPEHCTVSLAWVPLTPPVVHSMAAHVRASLHTWPWPGHRHHYIIQVPSMRGCRMWQVKLPQCCSPRSNE